MSDVTLEELASLAKRRGFIYQGSEIYGGLSGTWDYGPLGVALKRNIMNLWWKMFVDERDDMFGVDAAILMNQKVWQASGHVGGFTDPMAECNNCKTRFRVDNLIDIEEYKKYVNELEADSKKTDNTKLAHEMGFTPERLHKIIEHVGIAHNFTGFVAQTFLNDKAKVECPNCKKTEWNEPRTFNMMFKTNVGPVDDESSISYLRPETAQGIFTNYKNVVDSFYPDLPFGLAQQGKAFRNEISPRDFVFRSREFEQMEIEYFIKEDTWKDAFEKWVKDIEEFLDKLGLPKDKIKKIEVSDEDRAHYSKRTIDFEFDFPHGQKELLGLAYRTSFDLDNIQRVSGKSMEYTVKGTNEKFVPHVIEPSFGVERALMAVLATAYTVDEVNGEKRVFLKLPTHLAPIKFAVSPLLRNKEELVNKAKEVYSQLKKEYGAVIWDDNGNIGKRYRRSDEIGVPKHITIDFQTLEDGTVTVRDRDTTEQTRLDIASIKL